MVTRPTDIDCVSMTSNETANAPEEASEVPADDDDDPAVLPAIKAYYEPMTSSDEANCERQDSNLHGFPHWILNPARLPIPPLSRPCC